MFTNVLIGDEINRGSPKTQSALLEVMEERQVTADGVARPVPRPFFVIATQNPRDFQGTFPLPDVQLDRFTMRLSLGYTDHNTEVSVLEEYTTATPRRECRAPSPTPQRSSDVIDAVDKVDGRVAACTTTSSGSPNRPATHPDLRLGVSTRGTIALLRTARAWAATAERDYVTPDDVQDIAPAVCAIASR